ncbi:uncharacterized protein LOC128558698 [Mercenaria mercenaria]|uniref:uncharacterized protein LOC128558698 n=1 Tax=Mercenaria mercenaria TaxID=6596 RepID=UPI00234E8086|nr:uncharacterized protein LOC128558698 [Mercenaria mercenaria]
MNRVIQENSSSCSSDDQTDSMSYNKAIPTGVTEEHYMKDCKYERYTDTEEGGAFQIHIRICKCTSKYEDRSNLVQNKMDYMPTEGKEIHSDLACKWRRRKVMRCGQKIYMLEKYCNGCIQPETNTPMHAMNMVPASK